MADRRSGPQALTPPVILTLCLSALAVIAVLVGVVAGILALEAAGRAGGLDALAVAATIALFAAGCIAGGVLWAIAWLCRARWRDHLLQQRTAEVMTSLQSALLATAATADGSSPADALAASGQELRTMLDQLRQLNVNVLLSDDQRAVKQRHFVQRESGRLRGRIDRALIAQRPDEAREALDRLIDVWPDCPEVGGLDRAIERMRQRIQQQDVREASQQASNLMAAGRFAEAEAVAGGLLARHPNVPEGVSLLDRVRRERAAYEAEQRASLYRRIEQAASERHWRTALKAMEELVAAFPSSPEADAARAQMPTVTDNARLEEVRELRDRITDLIGRRRFAEAAGQAGDLIERFPDTAAAEDLRGQLDRLEELAKGGEGDGQ